MSRNNIYIGDCLIELKKVSSESVDLVYIDPPFFTQKIQKSKTRDNSNEYRFTDTWEDLPSYKLFMKQRIEECRRVLKDTGSIFLHCDSSASHYLRVILDDVFGAENFRSEIIWTYRRWSNSKRGLLNAHQTIYFYSKSERYKFNVLYTDYSPTTNIDQILQERERNEHGKSIYKRDTKGNIIWGKEKKGVPLSNVWEIPYLNPKAAERAGYPTQKPILLLERIIQITTDEGDIVLDPMCGSGTTLVAANILRRNWIGIDCLPEAVELTKARLDTPIKTISRLLEVGKEAYLNQGDKARIILDSIDALTVQRNNGIDGFLKVRHFGTPIAIRIQRENESLEDARRHLLKASITKGCMLKILIQTTPDLYTAISNTKTLDDNLLIIENTELTINQWLADKIESSKRKEASLL